MGRMSNFTTFITSRWRAYEQISEMCDRIAAAAEESGIGLTLLPVLLPAGRAATGGL